MAEPLVLIPGMMCDARLFGPQISDLSRDHAVMIAPSTMGERVEEIASGLLDLLPRKFALAGLSFGGIVAMELLRRAPDRITRLCLMATTPLPETPQQAAMREPQIIGVRAGRLTEVVRETMQPDFLAPSPARTEILALYEDMARNLGPDVFVNQSRALQRRRDQQSVLSKAKIPTLIMCGEHDGLTPAKRHTFMAELMPYAELKVIEGAGHLLTLEQPDAVNAALRDWMKQPLVLR